jgi:integrase/recombinase XerD
MSAHPSLATLLESFFRNRLTKQRNASPSTIASYRDALRMLILFAAERTGRKPCSLTVEDIERDLVLAFLDELEQKRKNAIQTRNARLTAIRSFFHHVAANDPGSLGIAQRILAIPIKRSHTEITHHLSRNELDVLIDAPDPQTPRGRRRSNVAALPGTHRRASFRGAWRQCLRSSIGSPATASAPARQGP